MNQRWVVIALPLTAFPGVEIKELFFTGLFKFTFILGKNLIKIQYRFPLKDQIRLQAWKAICTSGFIPDESSRLCSKHFATSSFFQTPRKRYKKLNFDAIPNDAISEEVMINDSTLSSQEHCAGQEIVQNKKQLSNEVKKKEIYISHWYFDE